MNFCHSRDILTIDQARPNDACKSDCSDDVWLGKYHKWKVYPFEEAIQCHRETHHPTVYNLPDSFVNAFIELDMTVIIVNSLKYILSYHE